jgi:hypothetical protein
LLDAWKNPVMPEFIASLPIVGIDGTMKKRLNGSEATGRAHIKTGTLDGVKTAAGYALDAQGRRYAVTFLINHPRAQPAARQSTPCSSGSPSAASARKCRCWKMSESRVFPAALFDQAGLNRQHVFAIDALPEAVRSTLGDTENFRQLILLGHGGKHLWRCVQAAGMAGENPIDDY